MNSLVIKPFAYRRNLLLKVLSTAYAALIMLQAQQAGVLVEWRNGFWFGLNYSSDNQTIPVPAKAKVLLGKKELEPAEVVVWQE